jgi:diaminopimelate epimerase
MSRRFDRAHGLGNDYLVVSRDFGLPLDEARVRRVCDRNRGVGSDGILLECAPPTGFDAAVRIFNPDGSEAEKSGNGVRIFAAWCFANGAARDRALRIHTLGGPVEAHFLEARDHAVWLRVSMGHVRWEMSALPMIGEGEHWTRRPLRIGDEDVIATCLSVGNPHAVLLGAACDETTLLRLGPLVEHHAQFPRRTNVQLCAPIDRRTVRALIWERGAGPTLASGSSACAVVAACVEAGLVDRDEDITVQMPGGALRVRIDRDDALEQVGPVQAIAHGEISEDLWSELAG